jgi:hypothetical protein
MTSETVRGLSLVSSEAAGFVRFLCSLRTDRLLCENAPRHEVDPLGMCRPAESDTFVMWRAYF